MSAIDDDRERFEEWATRKWPLFRLKRWPADAGVGCLTSNYRDITTQAAWLGWQAALRLERNKPSETAP